jgi:hypothetical protein
MAGDGFDVELVCGRVEEGYCRDVEASCQWTAVVCSSTGSRSGTVAVGE